MDGATPGGMIGSLKDRREQSDKLREEETEDAYMCILICLYSYCLYGMDTSDTCIC